jgi:hypothetical protein
MTTQRYYTNCQKVERETAANVVSADGVLGVERIPSLIIINPLPV